MTLTQLQYVIAIAECGSYNKASQILYVAQPSLTSSINELEKEVGIKIFSRNGRGAVLTTEGKEFLEYAKQVIYQYDRLLENFGSGSKRKKSFGISTQHYSFATKAFVELVKFYGTDEYEFAIRETKTREVIDDVAGLKSEIGILFLSDFNRAVLERLFKTSRLEFTPLTKCNAYVYLWKNHPLAKNESITLADLAEYPCLMFEQGEDGSYYYSEEILSTNVYPRTIKANDRATMLNLMIGLNGFTLCSGIICEELNGGDYISVPYKEDSENPNSIMEIGYIKKEGLELSHIGERYIEEIKKYLGLE